LVSNLILGYAVFGILSLLLIYPVRNHNENKWLKSFSRSFYYVLIPLILLLVWAVLARVIDYGVTEERYFLIILALWLSFICAYFLISKSQNIMIIPFSLCLVTVFSVYGPQGAFSTSKRSQIDELKQLFGKHESLEGEKVIALKIKPEKEDMARMLNIVDYLVNMHSLESFSPILKQNLGKVEDSLLAISIEKKYDFRSSRWEIRSRQKLWLYTYLNLEPDDESGAKLNVGINSIEAINMDFLLLNKADYMLPINLTGDTSSNMVNANKLLIYRIRNQNKIMIEFKKQKLIDKQALQVSRQFLSQEIEFDSLRLQILFNRISFNENKDLLSADAYVLISLKN